MRILFVIPTLKIGGAETFLINLFNYIKTHYNEEVYLLNLNLTNYYNINPLEKRLEISKEKYFKIKQLKFFIFFQKNKLFRKIYSWLFYKMYIKYEINEIKKIVKKINPAIINSHTINADRIIQFAKFNIPQIIVDHSEYSKRIYSDRIELLNNCNYIIAVSDFEKNKIKKYYKKDNIYQIYNGYEKTKVLNKSITKKELNIPDDYFVFSMIARVILEKGWIEALFAFSKFKYYNHSYFLAIGDGADLIEVKKFVINNKIKNVIFAGFQTEPSIYIKISDAVILPSYSESLGMSLIEALFENKPLIGTNVGGIPEIIKHENGDCGILVDMENQKPKIDNLINSMNLMHDNIEKYKVNIPHCLKKFEMEHCAKQYVNLFHSVTKI